MYSVRAHCRINTFSILVHVRGESARFSNLMMIISAARKKSPSIGGDWMGDSKWSASCYR